MSENMVRIAEDEVCRFATEAFASTGMPEADAAFHARALVDADLWGIGSHGIMRLPAYYARMLNGGVKVAPAIARIRGAGALEVLDGDAGSGFIVARDAMARAIALAKTHRIAAVGAVNSNHFGAGAIYARMASREGMIGIAMTGVKPLMSAPGAIGGVVGNNPLAVAIPTYGDFDFCLDMAMSKVAGGKLTLAIKKGESIPLDWATDPDGRPTSDPALAFKGFLLPMGDFKGLGLAYVVDILSGLITGGAFSDQIKSMYTDNRDPSLTSHFFIALDIDAIIGRDAMRERMAAYLDRLKRIPMLEPGTELYLPGELEHRHAEKVRAAGIPVAEKTYRELLAIKKEKNLAADLTPLA